MLCIYISLSLPQALCCVAHSIGGFAAVDSADAAYNKHLTYLASTSVQIRVRYVKKKKMEFE